MCIIDAAHDTSATTSGVDVVQELLLLLGRATCRCLDLKCNKLRHAIHLPVADQVTAADA
jgi:hypothetical protein